MISDYCRKPMPIALHPPVVLGVVFFAHLLLLCRKDFQLFLLTSFDSYLLQYSMSIFCMHFLNVCFIYAIKIYIDVYKEEWAILD